MKYIIASNNDRTIDEPAQEIHAFGCSHTKKRKYWNQVVAEAEKPEDLIVLENGETEADWKIANCCKISAHIIL